MTEANTTNLNTDAKTCPTDNCKDKNDATPSETAQRVTPAQPLPASTEIAPPLPADELIDIDYFAKVKLRVARIEAAEAVPKSKKLFKLALDLGPLGKRQIVSGIAQFYTPETLVGRKIVIVANLKPATLMGQESHGMLLAASSPDGTVLSILDPGSNLPEGSIVR